MSARVTTTGGRFISRREAEASDHLGAWSSEQEQIAESAQELKERFRRGAEPEPEPAADMSYGPIPGPLTPLASFQSGGQGNTRPAGAARSRKDDLLGLSSLGRSALTARSTMPARTLSARARQLLNLSSLGRTALAEWDSQS